MRIGINTRLLINGKLEGVAWYTHEICKRLVHNHPEIEFYFFFDRPYHDKFIFSNNITPVVVGPPARHPFLWYVWFEHSLKKAIEEHQIDVFFSPDAYLSLGLKIPTLISSHDLAYIHYPKHIPYMIRKYYSVYFPRFHEDATRIAAVSNATKSDIIHHYGINEDKIIVAHNACREEFKPLPESKQAEIRLKYSDGKSFFIYLGSINPRKNIPNLIRAFNLFKEQTGSDFKLLLVGTVAWKSGQFEKEMRDSPFAADIILLEEIKKEVYELLASAFALTYVSLFEGFGIPLLEAMASGVPVICSNILPFREVAEDACIYVKPKKPKTIMAAMKELIDKPNHRRDLIQKGFTQLDKFSWDQSAKKIGDALISLARD